MGKINGSVWRFSTLFFINFFYCHLLYVYRSLARGRERDVVGRFCNLRYLNFLSITKLLSLFFLSLVSLHSGALFTEIIQFFLFLSSFLWQICVYCSTALQTGTWSFFRSCLLSFPYFTIQKISLSCYVNAIEYRKFIYAQTRGSNFDDKILLSHNDYYFLFE